MERYAVEINTVAYTDSPLPEYFFGIAKRDHCIHVLIKSFAEQLVNLQPNTILPPKMREFLVVWISGYLGYCLDTGAAQFLEKPDEPRVGVLKTAGIHKLDLLANTVIVYTTVVNTLTQTGYGSYTIIGYYLVVDISLTMTVRGKSIIAQTDIVTVLAKSLHLIMNLLGDTTMLRETMINKK